MLVKMVKYVGFYVYHRSYYLCSPVIVGGFTAANVTTRGLPMPRSLMSKAKPIDADEPTEDVNCPLEVLKLVPEAFLREHLTRRCDFVVNPINARGPAALTLQS